MTWTTIDVNPNKPVPFQQLSIPRRTHMMETINCIEFTNGIESCLVSVRSTETSSSMLIKLGDFFDSISDSLENPSFSTPCDMAVLYVTSYANEFTGRVSGFTDFMKIHIVDTVPASATYKIKVNCGSLGEDGRPSITSEVL